VIRVLKEKKDSRVIRVPRVLLAQRVLQEGMDCKEKLVQLAKRVRLVLGENRGRRAILDYRVLKGMKVKRVQLEHLVKMAWMVQLVKKENVALED